MIENRTENGFLNANRKSFHIWINKNTVCLSSEQEKGNSLLFYSVAALYLTIKKEKIATRIKSTSFPICSLDILDKLDITH